MHTDPNPNLDPKFPEKSDPNPDPKKIISDPQHWGKYKPTLVGTIGEVGKK